MFRFPAQAQATLVLIFIITPTALVQEMASAVYRGRQTTPSAVVSVTFSQRSCALEAVCKALRKDMLSHVEE
jgi:hypothetical protein